MEDWRSGKTLLEKFIQIHSNKKDVKFLVGSPGQEEEIQASSSILLMMSPVFEKMFNETWKGQDEIIPLPDIQPTVFRAFLEVLTKLEFGMGIEEHTYILHPT